MSKIFEALKQAEIEGAKRRAPEPTPADFHERFERRKTRRVTISIPLFVYGYASKDDPFCEDAHTIDINAEGALISMQTAVHPGQKLAVTNKTNQKTQICTVLAVTARLGRSQEVALEFAAPAPQFWREPSRKPAAKKNP
jgi:hypothetical protein